MKHTRNQYGFTIVELTVVIVIIAILATITLVSYSIIRDKADDSAVQSDMYDFSEKLGMYYAKNGVYPKANYTNAPGTGADTVTQSVARGSYKLDVHNFVYCVATDQKSFGLVAVSKTGKQYSYLSSGTWGEYTGSMGRVVDVCSSYGFPGSSANISYGYNKDSKTWFNWVK